MYADIRAHGLLVQSLESIELGYKLFSWLYGLVFISPFAFMFTLSLFTQVGVVLFLRRYAESFWMSCSLYILMMWYYSSFNIIRQAMACVIVFYGYKHLKSGNFKRYLLFVLVAALFHESVLVMIPVYFLARGAAWSKRIVVCFGVTVAFYFFYPILAPAMAGLFSSSAYASYFDALVKGKTGANALRFGVAFVPAFFGFLFRKRIIEKYPDMNIPINMAAMKFFVMILSLKDIYFARLTSFFQVFIFLLIPCIVKIFDDKKTRFCLIFLIMLCYGVYHYILLPTENGVLPYRTIFEVSMDWSVTDRMVIW